MPFLVSKLYFKESEDVEVDPSDKTGFPIFWLLLSKQYLANTVLDSKLNLI